MGKVEVWGATTNMGCRLRGSRSGIAHTGFSYGYQRRPEGGTLPRRLGEVAEVT
jgi:hypothetical protein